MVGFIRVEKDKYGHDQYAMLTDNEGRMVAINAAFYAARIPSNTYTKGEDGEPYSIPIFDENAKCSGIITLWLGIMTDFHSYNST